MTDNNEKWKCSICGTENSGNFCCECGSKNPDCVPDKAPAQSVNSAVTADTWRCKVCGKNNTESKCSFCGNTKAENDAFIDPQQQVVPQITSFSFQNMQPARGLMCDTPDITQPDQNDAEPWLCTNCTHTNKGGEYCFNCGMPKSRAAKPGTVENNTSTDTWVCPDCNTESDKDAPFCPECGKLNPHITKREATAKIGRNVKEPWKCIKCGFENTGGLYCEKCDASKPPENSTFSGYIAINPQENTQQPIQPAFGLASLPDFIELEQMRRYNNKILKTEPDFCGCYTCSKVFESSKITTWNGDIAVCPYCQSETVIVKPKKDIDFAELLDKMNRFHIKNKRVDTWRKSGYKK